MFRVLVFVYGLACYAAFVASFALFALFLSGDAGGRTVDSGAVGPVRLALAADVALIALFGVPHSVMARASFKRRWTRLVPVALERSTYVLVSSVLLLALVRLWRPVPAVLWSAESPAAAGAARALFWGGLALTVAATFAFSHAELAGLDRVWAYLRRRERMGSTFRTPPLYRAVRHPMQLGVLLAVWATPVLTVGRLVLAAGLTAYVLVGLWFEERDLVRAFGAEYEAYRRRVPQLVPGVASLRALAHAARRVRARPAAPRLRPRGAPAVLAAAAVVTITGLVVRPTGRAQATASAPAAPRAPGLTRDTLRAGGLLRTYRVYAPREAGATRPPVGPRPVLVVLHGAYGNGALARALAAPALERLADRHGFVVAYPDAYADGWNDCRRLVPYAARRDGVDDVAFVRALVARLAATRGVDGGRAYALGFSNGGHLALRLALEAPAGVAGVAAVGAALPEADDAQPGCDGARGATAVLLVNGTADRVNPYAGGEVRLPDGRRAGRVLSSRATAEYFASLAGHAAPPHADTLAAAWPRARATRLEWRGAGAPAVALLTVPGGGHLLPRRAALTPLLGDASEQLDAVEEAVRFFGLDAARASRAARVAGGGRPSRILR